MSRALRVIQVGAGAHGPGLAATHRRTRDVQLVGLVDLDLDRSPRQRPRRGFAGVAVARSLDDCSTGWTPRR